MIEYKTKENNQNWDKVTVTEDPQAIEVVILQSLSQFDSQTPDHAGGTPGSSGFSIYQEFFKRPLFKDVMELPSSRFPPLFS